MSDFASIVYANQGATRNLPLSPQLAQLYDAAARAAGVTVRVSSGGQPASGPRRTGSTRHNHGNAGDIQLLVKGRQLDMTNPSDLPVIQKFIAEAHRLGATGIGAGTDYMGKHTFHVGYGAPAVWGAGGRGANAPQWLRDTVSKGVVPEVAAQNSSPSAAMQTATDNPAQEVTPNLFAPQLAQAATPFLSMLSDAVSSAQAPEPQPPSMADMIAEIARAQMLAPPKQEERLPFNTRPAPLDPMARGEAPRYFI